MILRVTLLTILAISLMPGAPVSRADSADVPSVKQISQKLRKLILTSRKAELREYLDHLRRLPGRNAAGGVIRTALGLPPQHEASYWLLLDEVARYRHGAAFTEMGIYVRRNGKLLVCRDLLSALRASDSKYLGRVIRRVLESPVMDLRLMAVDLAPNAPVRRTVDILLPVLEREDAAQKSSKGPTELKRRLILALEALTLQQFGDSVPNWRSWWDQNRAKGLRVLRAEARADHSPRRTTVVRPLDPIRQRQLFGVEDGQVRFLVVKGPVARNGYDTSLDHLEAVLERLNIPHDVVERGRLDDEKLSLSNYAAVLLNCTQLNSFCQTPAHYHGKGHSKGRLSDPCPPDSKEPHDIVDFKLSATAVAKLERWTEGGGYLFTEDWLLTDLLGRAWGKIIGAGGDLAEQTVPIRPTRGKSAHAFLRGVFVPPPSTVDVVDDSEELAEAGYDPAQEDDPGDSDEPGITVPVPEEEGAEEDPESSDRDRRVVVHRWRIDAESPSIDLRSRRVEVLVHSRDLATARTKGAVAVTFQVRQGRVLHVLSHFGRQASGDGDATLENLLINFLIEAGGRVR